MTGSTPDPSFDSSLDVRERAAGAALARALERLDGLVDWERRDRAPGGRAAMRQSVEPARDLLDRLGAPDRGARCVLVAGTKGKGSVAALVAAGWALDGGEVALYTSPHVESVRERLAIGGRPVPEDALAAALERALDAREAAVGEGSAGREATWFDVLTAAALAAARAAGVERIVLECGLGGRLDSTNAIEPIVSVVTNVDLEHTAILGGTRSAIATEKAAIARAGKALVSGVAGEAAGAVRRVAEERGARLVERPPVPGATIAEENVRLASTVLQELGVEAPSRAEDPDGHAAWMDAARLPGRLERFSLAGRTVVLDGAHVPASLERVLLELEELGPGPVVVLGAGADKDVSGLLKVLRRRVDRVLCSSPGRGPYAAPEHLLEEARRLGVPADEAPDPEVALDMALDIAGTDRWVLVTGSLHLVGRLRPLVAERAEKPGC